MVDDSVGGVLIEIKCGTAVKAVDLRDAGSCKHLLQVLSYVAMGRHGTIPLKCEWAFLVNPLTENKCIPFPAIRAYRKN